MNYLSDLHTHTIVSGHAYSTLIENVKQCSEKGMKILGVSDHGPTMPGAPHTWYFHNLRVLPRVINNVIILRGCESNILSVEGDLDIGDHPSLDYLIASLHEVCFKPKTKEENTNAVLNVLDRYSSIQILGHIGNPSYELDFDKILKKAKDKDVMIEINNSSLLGNSRKGSDIICKNIALLCKKYGVKIILSSDSHFCTTIGVFDNAIKMLREIEMPEELIMNAPSKLLAQLHSKGKALDLEI
ncbi:phosphatase [Clostridium gasigenes]|uniref:Phosphatase n=1 Tax=Clostridium gasigenes TaxID=94869 RepID=A0A7X0VSN6_9CLOT|nr:phosphatase [Clostridium gasigenes]MBB6716118.1 phosphatase [Clostridium gasigenes]